MKIAFMFLTYAKLSKSEIWYNYFKNVDDNKYSVYIHNKHDFNSKKNMHDKYFEKFIIKNKVETKWGHINLVRATINLLKESLLDQDNTFFYLVSDTTVPLKSFDEFYDFIMNKKNNIFKDVKQNCYYFDNERKKRYLSVSSKIHCSIEQFAYCSQWMILDRKTAEYFSENDQTTFFEDMSAPDEHYFITICNMKKIPYVHDDKILFTKWEKNGAHPKSYFNTDEVNQKELEGFYFFRKIINK